MAPWGRLDLPDAVRTMLREPSGDDFELHKNASGTWIVRARYHQSRFVDPARPETTTFSVSPAFEQSTMGMRLRALPAIAHSSGSADIEMLPLGAGGLEVRRSIGCRGQVGVPMPGTNGTASALLGDRAAASGVLMNASVEPAPAGTDVAARAMWLNYSAQGLPPDKRLDAIELTLKSQTKRTLQSASGKA